MTWAARCGHSSASPFSAMITRLTTGVATSAATRTSSALASGCDNAGAASRPRAGAALIGAKQIVPAMRRGRRQYCGGRASIVEADLVDEGGRLLAVRR